MMHYDVFYKYNLEKCENVQINIIGKIKNKNFKKAIDKPKEVC